MLNNHITSSLEKKLNFLSWLGFSSPHKLTPQQEEILMTIFVHKSYASDFIPTLSHNERLEFLGDSILGACISSFLYLSHPERSEADMTLYKISLVREETLADVARDINLGEELFISNGEEKQGGREKDAILSDSLEALIGACYLVYGYQQSYNFIKEVVGSYLGACIETNCKSHKSLIQERSQGSGFKIPHYETKEIKESNTNVFSSQIFIDGELRGSWQGKNKKKAQEEAAKDAYTSLIQNKSSISLDNI